MGFDVKRYSESKFIPRTQVVDVPTLAVYFDAGDTPTWTVRGLTANELAKAKDAQDRMQNAAALTEALLGGSKTEKVRALQESLGYSDSVHGDIARRMEMLSMGSIDPQCPLDLAVKLAQNHPETFYALSNQVLILTGQGAEESSKKPKPSGQTEKSEPV